MIYFYEFIEKSVIYFIAQCKIELLMKWLILCIVCSHNFCREFDVASLNFAGQVHRWRLSQVLQKGRSRTQDSLLNDLALSARFIVVTALTRISGHFLSVVESARALLRGLVLLVDMVAGVPSLLAHDLDYKIKEERCQFLIAELTCRVSTSHIFNFMRLFLFIPFSSLLCSRSTKVVWTHSAHMCDGNFDAPPPRNLTSNVNPRSRCHTNS